MPIETFPIGPLETNCHIVISGSDAVAVDPGGDLNSGLGEVLALLKEQNLTLRAILCTHFHFDHLYGVAALHEATGAPVYGPAGDASLLGTELGGSGAWGFPPVTTFQWEDLKEGPHTFVDGQVICNGLHNKIRLTDLRPGQTYYYRVCSQEIMLYQAYKKEFGETAVSPFYTFKVPSASQEDFTALIFNDLHKQIPTLDALYEQVRDIPYDFVVFNGDCIDDPANEKEALYHLAYLCGKVGASHVSAFFLRGNHEIRNAYSIGLRALFDYVGDKTYGAFSWGDTRFVMLDCGEDKPDSTWVYYGLNDFTGLRKDQVSFLSKELSGKEFKQASKRVLLNHIPIYGNGDAYEPCPELWGSLLAKAPFNVNISAHTHQYAFHPKGSLGNNFPVIVGGGYKLDSATVMVLRKKGNEMSVRVLNARGETLLDLKL